CPRTSARQGNGPAGGHAPGCAWGSGTVPARWAATSASVAARSTRSPGTQAATSALPAGSTSAAAGCSRATAKARGSGAPTGTSAPVRESSPASTRCCRPAGAAAPSGPGTATWPDASSTPSAIGKSKRADALGRSAGDRLTVRRPLGNSKPLLRMAALTRSRLSRTSVSGRPTTVKAGRPGPRCVSTRTAGASAPQRARLARMARVMAVAYGKPPVCKHGRGPEGPPCRDCHAKRGWPSGIGLGRGAALQRGHARLQLPHLRIGLINPLARTRQQLGLHIEFFARDQVHPGERLAHHGLDVAFEIGRRAAGDQVGQVLLKISKPLRAVHDSLAFMFGAYSVDANLFCTRPKTWAGRKRRRLIAQQKTESPPGDSQKQS